MLATWIHACRDVDDDYGKILIPMSAAQSKVIEVSPFSVITNTCCLTARKKCHATYPELICDVPWQFSNNPHLWQSLSCTWHGSWLNNVRICWSILIGISGCVDIVLLQAYRGLMEEGYSNQLSDLGRKLGIRLLLTIQALEEKKPHSAILRCIIIRG